MDEKYLHVTSQLISYDIIKEEERNDNNEKDDIYTQESREETPTNFQKYKNHTNTLVTKIKELEKRIQYDDDTNTSLKQELQTKLQDKDIIGAS